MPSKAVTQDNKLIYAGWYKSRFQILDKYPFIACPDCDGKMHPVQAPNKRLHFRHNASIDGCPGARLAQHIESPEHIAAKQFVFERLYTFIQNNKELSQYHSVDIEHALPHCGERGRKADVALLYKGIPWGVIECQFSRIDYSLLKQRIQDYAQLGIDSYWLLGGHANIEENRKLILKYTNHLCFVDVREEYVEQAGFEADLFGVREVLTTG
jgi:competence CoiA-like predicted nuclease